MLRRKRMDVYSENHKKHINAQSVGIYSKHCAPNTWYKLVHCMPFVWRFSEIPLTSSTSINRRSAIHLFSSVQTHVSRFIYSWQSEMLRYEVYGRDVLVTITRDALLRAETMRRFPRCITLPADKRVHTHAKLHLHRRHSAFAPSRWWSKYQA
jgi:hypothetical protein